MLYLAELYQGAEKKIFHLGQKSSLHSNMPDLIKFIQQNLKFFVLLLMAWILFLTLVLYFNSGTIKNIFDILFKKLYYNYYLKMKNEKCYTLAC